MEGFIRNEIVVITKKPPSNRGRNIRKYLPSTTTLFLSFYLIISLTLNGAFKPITKRGFFCQDSSISYPVKTDTVSFKWLLVIAFLIPALIIKRCDKKLRHLIERSSNNYSSELRKRRKISGDQNGLEPEEEELISGSSERIKKRLIVNADSSELLNQSLSSQSHSDSNESQQIPHDNGTQQQNHSSSNANSNFSNGMSYERTFSDTQLFLFGLTTTSFLTGIGKITGGRLRPHFMQRCKPDIDCNLASNQNRYIEDYNCTSGLRHKDLAYITTSWPSGHASIVFFSMLYLIFYLHSVIPIIVQLSPKKVQHRFHPILLYIVYVLLLGLAGFIALTRVSDYHHHPLDVLCGTIMGTIVAITVEKLELRYRIEIILTMIKNI